MESKFVTVAHACPFCGKEEFHLMEIFFGLSWLGAVLLVLAVVAGLRSLVTPKPTALGKSEAEWEKLVRNING